MDTEGLQGVLCRMTLGHLDHFTIYIQQVVSGQINKSLISFWYQLRVIKAAANCCVKENQKKGLDRLWFAPT